MRTRAAAAVVTIGVLVALTACGGAGTSTSSASSSARATVSGAAATASSTGTATDAGLTAAVTGPLRAVVQAGGDWTTAEITMQQATAPLVRRCLAKAGFTYTLAAPDRAAITHEGYVATYGTDLADPAFRTAQGYGVTSALVGLTADDASTPLQDYLATLSAARGRRFTAALTRCTTEAQARALPQDDLSTIYLARAEIADKVASAASVKAAVKAWARCLAAADQDGAGQGDVALDEAGATALDDPQTALEDQAAPLLDAAADPAATPGTAAVRLHRRELAIAAADWTCRTTTVVPATFAVRDRLENAYIAKHPALIARLRAAMTTLLAA